MSINIGDFIKTSHSQHPCCVISKNSTQTKYLVSVREYKGDYKWVKNVKKININEFQKLNEFSKYGNWWYTQHKDIYQSVLLVFLFNR
tara:strand:- start:64 stop:327 length:264 start_codon:yes stop_codon:yes gene_type:complete